MHMTENFMFLIPLYVTSVKQEYLKLEIERLRVKLRHLQKLNELAQKESLDANQKVSFTF